MESENMFKYSKGRQEKKNRNKNQTKQQQQNDRLKH